MEFYNVEYRPHSFLFRSLKVIEFDFGEDVCRNIYTIPDYQEFIWGKHIKFRRGVHLLWRFFAAMISLL